MKTSRLLSVLTLSLLASLAATACSSSDDNDADGDNKADGGLSRSDGGNTAEEEEEEEPHALGTIVLGETHSSAAGSQVVPIVSASFVPAVSKACGVEKIAGCTLTRAPSCLDADGEPGCGYEEYCTWGDNCQPTCQRIPYCDRVCDDDEICTLKRDDDNAAECVARDPFDAGPLAFSGTTTPITLYPPYSYESDSRGAPFLAGAELRVQAQGATEAGFEAFDEEFKATTFLQTKGKLSRTAAFGTGDLPIEWVAGDDTVEITVSSASGSAVCKANDADGTFAVPRAVLDAVRGEDHDWSYGLSVNVARVRTEVKKDQKAFGGSVNGVEVIEKGWLKLTTTSTETIALRGCSDGLAVCEEAGDTCTDLQNDNDNCGACGNRCSGSRTCAFGTCVTPEQACEACVEHAQSEPDLCQPYAQACRNNADCTRIVNCAGGCQTDACANECINNNGAGGERYYDLINCLSYSCSDFCY